MPTAIARRTSAPVVLALAGVVLQVAYPLVHGRLRNGLTVAAVALLFAAAAAHAITSRGIRWGTQALSLLVAVGFTAEAVGVASGFPFGRYAYSDSLGPELLGVPVVVPLAWAMLGYPCLVVGQDLAPGRRGAVVAAVALAGWDLFLDPQMVDAGHWHWASSSPGLNGIPLTNTLGWLLVALLMMAAVPEVPRADDRLPGAVLLWTYASSVVANLAFFGRPGVAVAGGIGMGLVAVPYALRA